MRQPRPNDKTLLPDAGFEGRSETDRGIQAVSRKNLARNHEKYQRCRRSGPGDLSAWRAHVHGDGGERAILFRGEVESGSRQPQGARVGSADVEISEAAAKCQAGRKVDVNGENLQVGKISAHQIIKLRDQNPPLLPCGGRVKFLLQDTQKHNAVAGHARLVTGRERSEILGCPDVTYLDRAFESEFVEVHLHIHWLRMAVEEPYEIG